MARTFDEKRVLRAAVRVITAVGGGHRRDRRPILLRPRRRERRAHDVSGLQFLRRLEAATRRLELPFVARSIPDPTRHGIEPTEIEIPTILIGLTAVEHRSLDDERAVIDGGRDDAKRDMCGVERVMTERRGRIVCGGRAVHERHGPECRLANGTTREREASRLRQRHSPDGRQLHEQVVRMLSVDQRMSVDRLAGLQDLAVAILSDRRRVETEHARQRQTSAGHLATRHAHPPVRHDELVAAARASLVIEFSEHDPVLHQLPAVVHIHLHLFVLIGVPAATGRRISRALRACVAGREKNADQTQHQSVLAPTGHHEMLLFDEDTRRSTHQRMRYTKH